MTEVTPNLPHLGNFCKYCFMGTLLLQQPLFFYRVRASHFPDDREQVFELIEIIDDGDHIVDDGAAR